MPSFDITAAMRLINKMRVFHGKRFSDQWAGIEIHEIAEAMIECLGDLSVEQLKLGYAQLTKSTFCPSITEFRAWCEPDAVWLSPEEAWANAQGARDENNTLVWTQQAATAYAACEPLLEANDTFNAARCFKNAYKREVDCAIARGIKPKPIVSLGFDPDKRIETVQAAESQNLIEHNEAQHLIGHAVEERKVKPEQAIKYCAQLRAAMDGKKWSESHA